MSPLYAAGSASLLVGLSIAIFVLLLISLILQIFPRIADRSGRRSGNDPALSAAMPAASAGAVVTGESDRQLVAVITAALSAYLSEQAAVSSMPAAGFRVRRIRRVS